jgi:hypothetical protein
MSSTKSNSIRNKKEPLVIQIPSKFTHVPRAQVRTADIFKTQPPAIEEQPDTIGRVCFIVGFFVAIAWFIGGCASRSDRWRRANIIASGVFLLIAVLLVWVLAQQERMVPRRSP